jgi:hypothetical protein
MRRWAIGIPAGIVGFALLAWLTAWQPLGVLAAVLAVIVAIATYLFPKDKRVGWLASFALAMVVIFPVHLVPTNLRYAELGMLALFAAFGIFYRGVKFLGGWIPVLFLAYLAVTYFSTQATGLSDAPAQFVMHAIVGIAFLVLGAVANPGERKTIFKTVLVLGVAEALYSLYEYVALPAVLWASPVPDKWVWLYTRLNNEILTGGLRSQGTFGHPLMLSFLLIVALGIALRFDFPRRGIRPILVVLFFAASIAAGSRSAALVMLAMVLFSYGMNRFAFLRGIALSGVVLTLAYAGSFFASSIVSRFTESGSLTHRQGALDAVPRLLTEQSADQVMFGNGWYSTQFVFDKGLLQLDGFVAIDNQFVALLVTTGVVGVIIFAVIPILAYARIGRTLRPVLVGAVGMFLVFDIFEFPSTWGLFALLIGMASVKVAAEPEPFLAPKKEAAPAFKKRQLPDWAAKHPELVGRSAPR